MNTSKFERFSNFLFGKDNKHRGELVKVILTVFTIALTLGAGLVAFLVWYSTDESVKEMKEQTKRIDEQIQVMYKGNVDTRFSNAIEHLGSENSTVVLGGIHALYQIAVEDTNYTQIVHNIFCNYLRENSAKLYEKQEFKESPKKCPVVIQILIDYLFKPYNNKDYIFKDYASDLSFSTLKNCNFSNANIENVNFDHCLLENCEFLNVRLIDCNFGRVTLKNCFFGSADLINCFFGSADLINSFFINAEFTNCDFTTTHSSFGPSVFLAGAILMECVFSAVKLTECIFSSNEVDAILIDCKFDDEVELINTEISPNQKAKAWQSIERKEFHLVPRE